MSVVADLCEAILRGECRQAEASARSALAAGADAAHLFTASVRPAMDEARRRFQTHQYYVPEMLIACRAMKAAMNEIRPRLAGCNSPPTAHVSVIGLTYQPEELTASLVADLLESAGLQVTRSTLAAPEAHQGQPRIAKSAVVLLVVPLCALSRGSTCWHSPARDTIKSLFCECASHGAKVILVGGDPGCYGDLTLDACVDDFSEVVPVVERLIESAGHASSGNREHHNA